jgi:chromosome segregation ATPase
MRSSLAALLVILAACRSGRPEPHETTLEQLRLVVADRAGQAAELEQKIRLLDRDLVLTRDRLAQAQARLTAEHGREADVLATLSNQLDLLTRAEQDRAAAEAAVEAARKRTAELQAEVQRLTTLEQRRAALPQELAAAEAALRAEEAKFAATRDAVARRADGLRRAQELLAVLAQQFPGAFGLALLPESQPASQPASQPGASR